MLLSRQPHPAVVPSPDTAMVPLPARAQGYKNSCLPKQPESRDTAGEQGHCCSAWLSQLAWPGSELVRHRRWRGLRDPLPSLLSSSPSQLKHWGCGGRNWVLWHSGPTAAPVSRCPTSAAVGLMWDESLEWACAPGLAAASSPKSNCRDNHTASLTTISALYVLHSSALTLPLPPPVS